MSICNCYLAWLLLFRLFFRIFYGLASCESTPERLSSQSILSYESSEESHLDLQRRLEGQILGRALYQMMFTDCNAYRQAYGLF